MVRHSDKSVKQRLLGELKSLGLAALYFGCWIAVLVLIKQLILAEYHIRFSGLSMVFIGTLVFAKVVLVLDHVSLGAWVRQRPAWVSVLLRTLLSAAGVFVVLVVERTLEGRHEHGGLRAALTAVFEQAGLAHVVVNTMCLSAALLVYYAAAVVRQHLGAGGFRRVFLEPVPEGAQGER